MLKKKKNQILKRLYFDIETSFNIVASWNIGYNLSLDHGAILKERAIICICYKWAHEKKVHYLTWNNGSDKAMLQKFMKIMNEADEIIGHNGDRYDIKWIRTRCLYHDIDAFPDYQSVDTLKLSKGGFRFNSNKLDYIAKFLGFGGKMDTGGFSLWKEIVLNNNSKALQKMVDYCKKDVLLLEKVHNKLKKYTKHKVNAAVLVGKGDCNCPECTSSNTKVSKYRISALGIKKVQLQCNDCGKYFTVSNVKFNKNNK